MLSRWNPDKHLRIRNPRLNLALRMTWYCMVVSSIGGLLFTLPFLMDFPNSKAENVTQALVLSLFFGGGTALLQRLLASILIGAFMAFVSGRFFKAVTNQWLYQLRHGADCRHSRSPLCADSACQILSVGTCRRRIPAVTGNEYPSLASTRAPFV